MVALVKSKTGERGIFNRGSLAKQIPERRAKFLEERIDTLGVNPCGEILLQPKQYCNLSEVVARAEDTEETLLKKMRVAAILGTYQASLTNFPYLSKEWKKIATKNASSAFPSPASGTAPPCGTRNVSASSATARSK